MGIKCFLLTPVDKIRVKLRRYSSGVACPNMPGEYSYHDIQALLGDFDFPKPVDGGYEQWDEFLESVRPPKEDSRWPRTCSCGYTFSDSSEWQLFTQRLCSRSDNGELIDWHSAPGGAMILATWYKSEQSGYGWDWENQLTPPLLVKCPNGHDWNIDSRASNCTLPSDKVHRCWIRHGEPPNVTVDKNGHTCGAGGGSIQAGDYHGFLVNGEFNP